MMSFGNTLRRVLKRPLTTALALGLGVALLTVLDATRAEAGSAAENAKKILEFDARNITPSKAYRIAYLTECGQNPYCSARRAGLEAAAQKYGFTYKRFAANFNPAAQIKQVQNAITEGFDGYLFAPTAAAAACSMWKRHLEPLDEPTVSLDLPMCDDATIRRAGGDDHHAAPSLLQRPCRQRARILHGVLRGCGGRRLRRFRPVRVLGERHPAGHREVPERGRGLRTSRRTSTRAWPWRKFRTRCSRIPKSR